jgi:hypothetical protein
LTIAGGFTGPVPVRSFKTEIDIYSGVISEFELWIFGQNYNQPLVNDLIMTTLALRHRSSYKIIQSRN